MILRQFLHFDPVGASYLLGCGGKASAAVIDPIGPVEPYLEAAATTGMKILYVIDTHIHADHISSGRILAEASGAKYVLFAGASWRPKDRFCCALLGRKGSRSGRCRRRSGQKHHGCLGGGINDRRQGPSFLVAHFALPLCAWSWQFTFQKGPLSEQGYEMTGLPAVALRGGPGSKRTAPLFQFVDGYVGSGARVGYHAD
ncbi:MBL fold metallo-hydrolase [Devosia geojensis]|uniref:MBL fold metallo-hydrolase n=1 Tax=Devosia geojensis TaxID=443610 RepID=UPI000A04DCBD|nr:MBL fold metallo-hydrolase [Devosia geojensis]